MKKTMFCLLLLFPILLLAQSGIGSYQISADTLRFNTSGNTINLITPIKTWGKITASDSLIISGAKFRYADGTQASGAALVSDANGVSTWQVPNGSGDVSGTFPNISVISLNGYLPSYYLARANHTGTQLWNTITSTPTTISGYGLTDAVNVSTTVNGHALSGNVSVTKSDVSLGNVPNTDCTNASNIVSGTLGAALLPSTTMQWVKVTKSYTDFSTASLTNTITIYTLPIKGVVHAVLIVPTTASAGGTIASYTASVGISANHTKYTGLTSLFTGFALPAINSLLYYESLTATTAITATATSTIGNLSAATAGSTDFYILVSTLQ